MRDIFSEAISPDNLAPCDICFRIPKVLELKCAIGGQDAYRVQCACKRGTYSSLNRQEVIDCWNRNQDYENGEWSRAFAKKIHAMCFPRGNG